MNTTETSEKLWPTSGVSDSHLGEEKTLPFAAAFFRVDVYYNETFKKIES